MASLISVTFVIGSEYKQVQVWTFLLERRGWVFFRRNVSGVQNFNPYIRGKSPNSRSSFKYKMLQQIYQTKITKKENINVVMFWEIPRWMSKTTLFFKQVSLLVVNYSVINMSHNNSNLLRKSYIRYMTIVLQMFTIRKNNIQDITSWEHTVCQSLIG